jgi:DNA-binding XRE family transcriptional regulator
LTGECRSRPGYGLYIAWRAPPSARAGRLEGPAKRCHWRCRSPTARPGYPNSGGAADRRRPHPEEAAGAKAASKGRRGTTRCGQDQRLQLGGESVQPGNSVYARIIRYLGYDPLPQANTLAEQLVQQRTKLGLSQKESAERIGVDPGTLAKWERGERESVRRLLDLVNAFLHEDGEWRSSTRRAG